MASEASLKQCYNKGCGKKYSEEEDAEGDPYQIIINYTMIIPLMTTFIFWIFSVFFRCMYPSSWSTSVSRCNEGEWWTYFDDDPFIWVWLCVYVVVYIGMVVL